MVSSGGMDRALATKEEGALAPPTALDRAEARLLQLGGQVQARGEVLPEFPIVHRFTPGMYIRQITMPKGAMLTSKVHRTEHPFTVSKGRCLVLVEETGEWEEIQAPYTGITKPGTRRLLVIEEETVWTTYHVTELRDPAAIEDAILADYQNPLLVESRS